jgi:virginiamycin B lyase
VGYGVPLSGVTVPLAGKGSRSAHIVEYPVAPGTGPLDLKVGPDGLMYFSEGLTNRLGRIDPKTHQMMEFQLPSPNCTMPYAVNPGPGNALWFSTAGGCLHSIGRLDLVTFKIDLHLIPSPWAYPADLKTGPDGGVWFTESTANKISRIDPVTRAFSEYDVPTPASNPQDVAVVADDGGVWFSEMQGNKLARIDPSTHAISEYPYPTRNAQTLDVDPGSDHHQVWFTEIGGNKVGFFDPRNRQFREFDLPTPAADPLTVGAGPDNAMYVLEQAAGKVARVDPSTYQITEIPVPTPAPVLVDISCEKAPNLVQAMHYDPCLPDGNLWFAEFRGDRIGEVQF